MRLKRLWNRLLHVTWELHTERECGCASRASTCNETIRTALR